MSDLKQQIKDWVKQEEPDYWQGVELYSQHPQAKKNLIINLNQRWNKEIMHFKLLSEMERLAGVKKYTQRKAKLNERPQNVPVKIVTKTEEEAPQNFEYKIKYNDLPEELKKMVIEKGQLYNALQVNKKKLANIGEANDDKSVAKRTVILRDMQRQADRIKKIHSLLLKFEENNAFAPNEQLPPEKVNEIVNNAKAFFEEVEHLNKNKVGKVMRIDFEEPESEDEMSEEDLLDKHFKYKEMDYWQRKALLHKTRSAHSKQKRRAKEADSEKVRENNLQKAELTAKMIALLEDYFKNTPEPEK